ncbi:ATP-dependent dethiobiotin synthetase BioD [Buchnera aphidicola (Takecallis arundicolens)]|uniref:dethiobiotin synthase n=1 Tax=Buchnera aphidicola TaxID=9 RepID=UPI00346434E5
MIKTWFVTGTDTNVGKTIVSVLLLKKATIIGFNTAGYKPVSSGCIKTIYGLRNHDALLLKKHSVIKFKYKEINPYSFYGNIPPNFFYCKKNNITFKNLSDKLHNIQKKANWIIIEGIGGWDTPIFNTNTLSNWIKEEKIPVILVISIKLGCINHAILTVKSIIASGLKLTGWFANCMNYEQYLLNYIYTIKQYIKSPFLGIIPYIQDINNICTNNINIILPE